MADRIRETINYIAKEWRVIQRAPAAAIFFAVLAVVAITVVEEIRYGDRIDSLEATKENLKTVNETLNQRVEFANEQLAEYRQKLQVDSPDAAAAKLRDSETEIAELKDRELRPVEQKFKENSDGTYTISTVMQVVSSSPPAGLCIRVEAEGFIEMTVEEVDPQPSVLRSIVQETPDIWYIHSPSGTFLITVRAKSPNGTLHYQFDKRDC